MADGEMWLRPYQLHGINALRDEFRSGKKRVVYYGPCGSGKTEAACELIRAAVAKGSRVVFAVNRVQLVLQASERLTKSGINHGIMQGSNTCDVNSRVLVCSIATLARRGFPKDIDLLIIDECHGAAGSTAYKQLIFGAQVPVVGLSATPFSRGLGKVYPELGGALFESIAKSATIPELIELGFLVDLEAYAPQEPDLDGVSMLGGDYREDELAARVDKDELVGGIVSHWRKLAGGRRTVVFATNIAHSLHIVKEFQAAGIPTAHMDCWTSTGERASILARLEAGEITVLSNVSVLAEGWNAPCIEVMVLARPTRSLVRFLQMVGRALRPYPGKKMALLLDHSGSIRRFRFPTAELPLVLNDGTRPKPSAAEEEKHEAALPKVCPNCHYVKAAGVHKCPQCGFEPTRPPLALPVANRELTKYEKRTKPKQEFWSELQHIGAARGYSSGRRAHLYRDYYGVWPRGLVDNPRTPSAETLNFIHSRNIAYAKGQQKAQTPAKLI